MRKRNGRGRTRDKTCVCFASDLQGQHDPVPPDISILSWPQAPCIGQGSFLKETEPHKEICCKESVHAVIETQKSHAPPPASRTAGGVSSSLSTRENRCPSPKIQFGKRENSPLFLLLVLVRPLTDWTRPTQVRAGNLLHSVYRFKCSQKHPR